MNPNLEFALPSFIFCIIDVLVLRHANKEKFQTDKQKVFNIFGIVILLQQIASTIMTIQQRGAGSVNFVVMNLSCIFLFTCMTAASQSLIRYTVTLEKDGDQATRGFIIINAIPLILMTFFCLLSPWTHWIFYVDKATGMYERGSLFILQIILPYLYFFIEMGYIAKQKLKGKSVSLLAKQFVGFFLPSLLGVVVQMMGYVGGYSSIGISCGMIILYLDLYIDEMNDAKRLRETEALNAQLEASNKAKTSFLFNMSHDIRTPMNAIIGFTNMAIKHIDDKERVLDSLSKTQSSSELLLNLINSILDMSRIESGNITLEENKVDITYSFVDIETTMRELAASKNIDLSFEVDEIKDKYVYADVSRCIRVFINIITNAIKYTPVGGKVEVKCEQLGSENGVGTYLYTFKDSGIGIGDEFKDKIFEAFSREETATVSGIQGTGLGLTVCNTFVTAMGGTITFNSEQGKGTTFYVTLPFKLQTGDTYINEKNAHFVGNKLEKELEQKDFSNIKVLVVEDNELNLEIAQDILSEEGMTVESASDGSFAIEMLKERGPDFYNFILMDIQMPITNGYEATKQIRKMYPNSKLPIIALSANAFAEDKAASLAAGMNDHIAKPINIDELKAVINKYI